MRQLIILLISLLLVAGSLAATLGSVQLREFELRGYADPTQVQDLPFTVPRPGVNVELLQYTEAELRRNLELIAKSNFRWLRQFVYWDEIETQPGSYDWAGWDRLAAALTDFPELELVAVLMNSPPWARASGGSPPTASAPPRSLAEFTAFASAFAARYGERIDYYQIWDEPNLADAWGGYEPKPLEYIALLAAARSGILGADADATIVAAALAPTTETGGRNISDIRYLDALYANDAGALFDIVAGKPYGFSASPLDRRVAESRLNFSRIIALRELMQDYGDGRKALWASHFGWNALPAGWTGAASIWGAVSASEQITYTVQALDRAHREWSWLGAMFLQHWQPAAPPSSAQWGFALLDQKGAPTALLEAIQAYPFPQVAQNGLFHARSAHARYSGVWQFSELGADIGWLPVTDSQLEFDFYGSDLSLLLREDEYLAFLYPEVDGAPANATQTDASGNAYIFLRSNSRQPELNLVPVARELPLARHTLSAAADQGWDRWALAGYAVSSGNLAAPYNRQIALGSLSALLSALVLLFALAAAPWAEWLPPLARLLTTLRSLTHLLATAVTSVFMLLAMLWTWDSPRASLLQREEVNVLLALLTGGALYLSPSFLLSIALAGLLFVLIYQRLESGLILTLFWAPFFLFPVTLHSYAIPMVEVMLLITAAAGGWRLMVWLGKTLQMGNSHYALIPGERFKSLTPIDWAALVLGLLALLSLLWTRYPGPALTELRSLIAEPLLFYLLLRGVKPDKQSLSRLFLTLVLSGIIVAVVGLYLYFVVGATITAEAGAVRLQSVYGSPNNVGLLFGRALPIALGFALVPLAARLRWLAAASFAVMAFALVLTQSVGALLLGLPAGIAAVLSSRYRKKALIPLIGLFIGGMLAFIMLTQVSARFANLLDFSSGTNFVRLRLWESSLDILSAQPLTGIGMDQFLYLYGGEYLRPDVVWNPDLSHPHNVLLDLWTRLGLLGVAAFLVIQAAFWRGILRLLRNYRAGDPLYFAMTIGLAGSMAGLLAHGLIDNSIFVIDLAFIFMFQLAAMQRLQELSSGR